MVRISSLAVAMIILGGTEGAWAGGKPDPTPDWRCQIVFHERSGDKITSDGKGAYVDGVGGVTCYVINEPGTTQDRWLFMSITSTQRTPPTRVVRFIGQTYPEFGPSYASFDNQGTFEVKGFGRVAESDVMPFRAYVRGPDVASKFKDGYATVDGDSNLIGSFTVGLPDPTSSVFVAKVPSVCSWDITSNFTQALDAREQTDTSTNPRLMRITEGAFDRVHTAILRGDFPMPFAATVTLTPNANGCPR